MADTSSVPVIYLLIGVTYLILVGSISWVAWSRHDDGTRGLAMALCTSSLSYVLVGIDLPDTVAMAGYYILTAQAHVFLQSGVLKNFEQRMLWGLGEIPVVVLVVCVACYPEDPVGIAPICYGIYALQYAVIGYTAVRRKVSYPSCGSNMVLAGMCLATIFSLWWAYMIYRAPEFIEESAHPANYQTQLDLLIYIIGLLTSNGFILMTKARLEGKLQEVRQYDSLSGLRTTHGLKISVEKHLARLRELAIPTTLILIDIDHFKEINRRYSYQDGNRILHELGALLQQACSESSELFRLEGDSFAVLIPGLGIYQIIALAERLRMHIAGHKFIHGCQLTVSCGISVACSRDNWSSWQARGRHALLRARAYGRDQMQTAAMDFSTDNLPNGVACVGQLHWYPNYSSGLEEIDALHRKLLERTNIILQLWSRPTDMETVWTTSENFLRLVRSHFEAEKQAFERLQKIAKTPRPPEENEESRLTRAEDLLERYKKNTLTNNDLFNFLVFDLVLDHISAFSEKNISGPLNAVSPPAVKAYA